MRILALDFDVHAMRLEYEITPALPDMRPPLAELSETWRPPVRWNWFASDDLGNKYHSVGGAYGPAQGGRATRGVLSLLPFPPQDAGILRISLSPSGNAESDVNRWIIDVPLQTSEDG